ncbi:MAG TPA: hypothetical protein DEP63_04900 [Candidatus Magasanikbacteria bacterium]|nr:hypothetical protein [Candidatus Magasanikbacteria bacterium]HCC14054.1 hypothetical protein [Candidatus Magasanikbacteria bacterium]HCM53396.1 hypothetical protein [Candidatus Magasanikbacteria bacterium]
MGKACGCSASKVLYALVIIGALNWGLVGLGGFFDGNWNVVNLLLGSWAWLEWLVYLLVGVSGVVMLMGGCKCSKCKACCTESTVKKEM